MARPEKKIKSKKTSFVLSQNDLRHLEELSDSLSLEKTEIVRLGIEVLRLLHSRGPGNKFQVVSGENTETLLIPYIS